jgi:hypothetical protein
MRLGMKDQVLGEGLHFRIVRARFLYCVKPVSNLSHPAGDNPTPLTLL